MKPERIQRKRSKGWRMPENTVYVGRGSKWGNPFLWKPKGRAWAVDQYRRLITGKMPFRELLELATSPAGVIRMMCLHAYMKKLRMEAKVELRGKNLACWCAAGEKCHADVLLRIANK